MRPSVTIVGFPNRDDLLNSRPSFVEILVFICPVRTNHEDREVLRLSAREVWIRVACYRLFGCDVILVRGLRFLGIFESLAFIKKDFFLLSSKTMKINLFSQE